MSAIDKLPRLHVLEPPAALSTNTPQTVIKDWLMKALTEFIDLAYYLFLLAILASAVMYLLSAGNEEKLATSKKNFVWAITGFIIISFAYSIVALVARQSETILTGALTAGSVATFRLITLRIFKLISTFAVAGFFVLLLFAGFRYMTAAGNEEAASNAKKQIIHSAIGIILTLSSLAIGLLVMHFIQLLATT